MAKISTGYSDSPGILGLGQGQIQVVSSFGVSGTTLGAGFRARGVLTSDRTRMLAWRESYFRCTTNDKKSFDFDGRVIKPGPPFSQPMLSSEQSAYYVPLKSRRPSSPYRLPRVIVNSFTSLLFGYGRWPTIRVHGDSRTEQFIRSCEKVANLRNHMIRARNIGGSTGTSLLSWRFFDGKPRFQTHNPKHIFVHEWVDREMLMPAHVSELYLYSKEVYDGSKKEWVTKWFWYRHDWTEAADVTFFPVEYDPDQEPQWSIDEKRSIMHRGGLCHFIWIQNLPEEDSTSVDGQPDYAELYESFDSIDILKSVVVRGATLNLDPTLVLKLDPDIMSRTGVEKGSDNALVVGEDGDAKYMELAGNSITAGIELLKNMRAAILETAQCVIPDPDKVTGSGMNGAPLKLIYEPALAKADIMREQYGRGIKQLFEQVTHVARVVVSVPEMRPAVDDDGDPVLDIAGAQIEEEIVGQLDLPPVFREEPIIDQATGQPDVDEVTGKVKMNLLREDVVPGDGGEIELDWGDYFNPTESDRNQATTTINLAVGAKVMSRQTGSEEMSKMYELDPQREWARLEHEAEIEIRQQAEFDDPGYVGGKEDSNKKDGASSPRKTRSSSSEEAASPPSDTQT